MAMPYGMPDFTVTREKVDEAVRRIVQTAHPLQIIAFGSRARGDHRPDSDLDLGVILDAPDAKVREILPYSVLCGLNMEVDLIVASRKRYEHLRPWRNSVYNYIWKQGVVLYDREHPERACPDALRTSERGRVDSDISAA